MCNRLNTTLKRIHTKKIEYVQSLTIKQNKAYFIKMICMSFTQITGKLIIGVRTASMHEPILLLRLKKA